MASTTARIPMPPRSHQELSGWRLTVILASVFTGLFLSFLDTTIVAVSLTTISSQFSSYSLSTWVVTAYLLTYMAFGIIMARLSDIFGQKTIEVASFTIFLVFSLACALSKTMIQLIVFRALQGLGGSGLFSMTMVIPFAIVDLQNMPVLSVAVSLTSVIAGVLGPVLGGAISQDTTSSTWRWIFWINLPIAGSALVALLVAWPHDKSQKKFTRQAFASIDFFGAAMLLVFSILLVFALQEAGAYVHAWSSATIIASLTLSGVVFVVFLVWQELLSRRPAWVVKGIFPLEVAKMRVMGASITVTLIGGFVYYIAIVNLPQRFEIVSGDSAVLAGVKLLPVMASAALGTFVAGSLARKRNFTGLSTVASMAIQVLGYGLMSTLGSAGGTPKAVYGYQIFLGFGFGMQIASATIMAQFQFERRPQFLASAQGALTQMRSLGGSIGLAIAVIIFNMRIRTSQALTESLSTAQRTAVFKSPLAIKTFSPQQQALVSEVYAKAFSEQMRVATYVVAVGFVVSLLTLERNPPHSSSMATEAPQMAQEATRVNDGNSNSRLREKEKPGVRTVSASSERGDSPTDLENKVVEQV